MSEWSEVKSSKQKAAAPATPEAALTKAQLKNAKRAARRKEKVGVLVALASESDDAFAQDARRTLLARRAPETPRRPGAPPLTPSTPRNPRR